jgi:hypothetical protein
MEIIIVGFKNDEVTNVKDTLKQIEQVKKFKLELVDDLGILIHWNRLDDYQNKKTNFYLGEMKWMN